MNKEIVSIDINKLGIDRCNIREGMWDEDPELVQSVKDKGIIQPLTVRLVESTGNEKYGIVCGSRRYNAAIIADLEEVPCIIQDLNDEEAMGISLIENRHRKDIPTWKNIEWVGKLYEKDPTPRRYKKIAKLTGIAELTVKYYLDIYNLPEEIKGLIRKPEERTERQKEYLKNFRFVRFSKALPIGHAKLIAQELNSFSWEKQMEVTIFVLNKPSYVAEIIIEAVKENPHKPIDELYKEIMDESYRTQARVLYLDRESSDALKDACMNRQIYYSDLLMKIIRNWLIKHKYLKKHATTEIDESYFIEKGEAYVKVNAPIQRFEKCRYHFLKTEGKINFYQKGIRGYSGFYKVFCKENTAWLTLTPGTYKNPKELLNQEKERLEGKR